MAIDKCVPLVPHMVQVADAHIYTFRYIHRCDLIFSQATLIRYW